MTLSNKLTLSRVGMTFLLMRFLFIQTFWGKFLALVVFSLACLTDFLDGWLARKRKEVSNFGKIMDPVADKILVLGVFLTFVELQLVPAWMVIVIFLREFLITGMRFSAVRKGVVLAAESAGKHKTFSQMFTIFFILVFLIVRDSQISSSFWNPVYQEGFKSAIFVLMCVTVGLTLCSGFSYVWQNRKLIRRL